MKATRIDAALNCPRLEVHLSNTVYRIFSKEDIQGVGYTYLAKSASEPVSARMIPAK